MGVCVGQAQHVVFPCRVENKRIHRCVERRLHHAQQHRVAHIGPAGTESETDTSNATERMSGHDSRRGQLQVVVVGNDPRTRTRPMAGQLVRGQIVEVKTGPFATETVGAGNKIARVGGAAAIGPHITEIQRARIKPREAQCIDIVLGYHRVDGGAASDDGHLRAVGAHKLSEVEAGRSIVGAIAMIVFVGRMPDLQLVDIAAVKRVFKRMDIAQRQTAVEERVARPQLIVDMHTLVVCHYLDGVKHPEMLTVVTLGNGAHNDGGTRSVVVDIKTQYRTAVHLHVGQQGGGIVAPIKTPRGQPQRMAGIAVVGLRPHLRIAVHLVHAAPIAPLIAPRIVVVQRIEPLAVGHRIVLLGSAHRLPEILARLGAGTVDIEVVIRRRRQPRHTAAGDMKEGVHRAGANGEIARTILYQHRIVGLGPTKLHRGAATVHQTHAVHQRHSSLHSQNIKTTRPHAAHAHSNVTTGGGGRHRGRQRMTSSVQRVGSQRHKRRGVVGIVHRTNGDDGAVAVVAEIIHRHLLARQPRQALADQIVSLAVIVVVVAVGIQIDVAETGTVVVEIKVIATKTERTVHTGSVYGPALRHTCPIIEI